MSANIVLPNLPNWFEQRVTAMYKASTTEEFNAAFDAFVAHDVTIKVNGKTMSRDHYKKMVMGEIKGDVSATVSYNGIVSVPSVSKDADAIGTGSVGAIFKATVFGKIFVLGRRESSTINSCMNVDVIHDRSLHHHQVGHGGAFDARRVSSIVEALTDEENRITVPPLQPPTA